MADDRRRTLLRLIRHTIEQQSRVDFYQLVRILERYLTAHSELARRPLKPIGRNAVDEDPSVQFRTDTANRPRAAALRPLAEIPEPNANPPVELVTSFMSLFGTAGILPQTYTTLILERVRAGDTALRDYLDVFHQRLTELAYQVWERSRPDIAWERSATESQQKMHDRFSVMLKSLVGATRGSADAVDENTRLYFSAFYSDRRRPVLSLESMLSEYFRIPVAIQQFHPRSVLLKDDDQWRLPGKPKRRVHQPKLGQGLIAGRKVSIVQTRILIQLGLLEYHQFRDFLPNGRKATAFRKLVRSFVGPEFEIEVELKLDSRQTPDMRPGQSGEQNRLGWNTWLTGHRAATAQRSTRFVIRD